MSKSQIYCKRLTGTTTDLHT